MKTPVGIRLRKVRRALDLTQEALAEKSGLSPITISRLERGTAKEVYADTVADLARAMGISGDYLLGLTTTVKMLNETDTPPPTGFLLVAPPG